MALSPKGAISVSMLSHIAPKIESSRLGTSSTTSSPRSGRGGFGVLRLITPETATALWPWSADAFTGRVYSGMFLAADVGAFMLSTRSSPADDFAFGLTQLTLGIASLASFFLATLPPQRYVQTTRPTGYWGAPQSSPVVSSLWPLPAGRAWHRPSLRMRGRIACGDPWQDYVP